MEDKHKLYLKYFYFLFNEMISDIGKKYGKQDQQRTIKIIRTYDPEFHFLKDKVDDIKGIRDIPKDINRF